MRQYVTADACFTLNLPEVDDYDDFTIYPNPAAVGQKITISADVKVERIRVYNELGRLIMESKIDEFALDRAGLYVLDIMFETGTNHRGTFIVQ
jgi:hypothetical protein